MMARPLLFTIKGLRLHQGADTQHAR